MEAGVRVAGP